MQTELAGRTDTPDIFRADPDRLSLALMDARNRTLHLLAQLEQAPGGASLVPAEGWPAPLWTIGHIGWVAEYWIARNPQRALGPACPEDGVRLASVEPGADRWWGTVEADPGRAPADLPDAQATRAWLLDTLETTLELLEKTPHDDRALHFFRLALRHEDQCSEWLCRHAQASGVPLPVTLPPALAAREPLLLPASRWRLQPAPGGYVPDLEQGGEEAQVPEFEIDAQPVSWAQYVEFVDDGGYDRAELWQPQGWDWLQQMAAREGRRGPRHVEQIGVASGAVLQQRFGRAVRMAPGQPVMHVSWWEADAWCRWAGRRLPTGAEWDIAAQQAARRGFRWGEVHEWTAGTLRAWAGYAPEPGAADVDWDAPRAFGQARVLRGASFATAPRLRSVSRRGHALPERDDLFVGFRSCAL